MLQAAEGRWLARWERRAAKDRWLRVVCKACTTRSSSGRDTTGWWRRGTWRARAGRCSCSSGGTWSVARASPRRCSRATASRPPPTWSACSRSASCATSSCAGLATRCCRRTRPILRHTSTGATCSCTPISAAPAKRWPDSRGVTPSVTPRTSASSSAWHASSSRCSWRRRRTSRRDGPPTSPRSAGWAGACFGSHPRSSGISPACLLPPRVRSWMTGSNRTSGSWRGPPTA